MFFSRKLEISSSAGNLTSPMIRLFLVAHGPLTEGNVTTFVRVLLETCSSHANVCILTTCILTNRSISKYCTDFKCCRSIHFSLFFLYSNGMTQMSTNAPFQCYASQHTWSLPSIPENGRRVCIWIRCVDIEQQFSIARNQWSEQQFLQLLTTAGLWDICQFIVVYNLKYKKSVQQKHIDRIMICLTSCSFTSLLYNDQWRVLVPQLPGFIHMNYTLMLSQYIYIYIYKATPLQAWTGPQGSRRLRLPDFMTDGTWRW